MSLPMLPTTKKGSDQVPTKSEDMLSQFQERISQFKRSKNSGSEARFNDMNEAKNYKYDY